VLQKHRRFFFASRAFNLPAGLDLASMPYGFSSYTLDLA